MLPRARRAGKHHFKTQQNRGFLVSTVLFSIKKISTTPPGAPAKFAVIVSHAVGKKAVDRNTLRRRVYAVLRTSEIGSRTGATYVFYAKKEARGASSKKILSDIMQVFGNTHVQ
ncbi:MAG: ribonuclease P protein component [Minisyncoccota bacterium]